MIWFLYNVLFSIAFVLMLPKFISRMMRRGGYRLHFEQRIGIYGHGTAARLTEADYIWIHAVSVGEINVALRFIKAYREEHPDACFVVSTTTSTAHTIGERELGPDDVLIYFPVDAPFIMRKALDAINPQKLILVECEFWPNLIRLARKRGIPVSLINGRVSDSSFKGYMKLRPLTRRVLELIDPICVQGRQDAERMIAMGARPETVKTLGTAKYDLPPPAPDADAAGTAILRKIGVPAESRILVAGSTWPGEEEVISKIYQRLRVDHPELFLVLIPRHVERRDEVVAAVEGLGLSCALRSIGQSEKRPDVLIVDTTGEIMTFYAIANLVFVGKSLTEHGGQNPIEPALLGKPIVVGPNMENFPAVMDDFLSAGAIRQVDDVQGLENTIRDLLNDSPASGQLGAAARSVVESRRGAVERMVESVG